MRILSKLFAIFKKPKKNEDIKEPDFWYNNQHEKGEIYRGNTASGASGNGNGFECSITKSAARK